MVLLSNLGAYTEPDPKEDPYVAPPPVVFPTGQIDPKPAVTPVVTAAHVPGGGGGVVGNPGMNFPEFDVGRAPDFHGARFSLPTAESVLNLPGYKFREQQGRDALEHSAAAKGLTRTGGTLKDLASWNQGFASQEYDAEARRQLGAFQQNYQAQKDEFAPNFANWQFLSNAALQKALAQYQRGTIWNNPHPGGGGGLGYDPDPKPDPSQYGVHY